MSTITGIECHSNNTHDLLDSDKLQTLSSISISTRLTLFRMGFFGAAHTNGGWRGGKKAPIPNICHTHPTTMMKLGTLLPFATSRNTDIDFILIHYF